MQLGENLLDEIEHFFVSYNEMKGKRFEPLGRFGAERAERVVEEGERRFRAGRGKADAKKKSVRKRPGGAAKKRR
jgi:inorganic pyrophosphatase